MTFEMIQKLAVGAALAITGTACTQDAPRTPEDLARWSDASLWSMKLTDIDGDQKSLSEYKGRVALVVNVASRCGYTPQYKQLQKLHESMKGSDFVLMGIPSNDFGGQEPGTSEQIKDFCTTRYGVDFPHVPEAAGEGGGEAERSLCFARYPVGKTARLELLQVRRGARRQGRRVLPLQ